MANHNQTSVSCFATVNASVFVAPPRTRDIISIEIEMDTTIRSYSYFSSEHLRENISNTKLLIESFNANEDILDLWRIPCNTITSSNKKAGGSANIYLTMSHRLPLAELFDRTTIVPSGHFATKTSSCRTTISRKYKPRTRVGFSISFAQMLSIHSHIECFMTTVETLNFRTFVELFNTDEDMSILPRNTIMPFIECITIESASENRLKLQGCRVRDCIFPRFGETNLPEKHSYILFLAPLDILDSGTNTHTPHHQPL